MHGGSTAAAQAVAHLYSWCPLCRCGCLQIISTGRWRLQQLHRGRSQRCSEDSTSVDEHGRLLLGGGMHWLLLLVLPAGCNQELLPRPTPRPGGQEPAATGLQRCTGHDRCNWGADGPLSTEVELI